MQTKCLWQSFSSITCWALLFSSEVFRFPTFNLKSNRLCLNNKALLHFVTIFKKLINLKYSSEYWMTRSWIASLISYSRQPLNYSKRLAPQARCQRKNKVKTSRKSDTLPLTWYLSRCLPKAVKRSTFFLVIFSTLIRLAAVCLRSVLNITWWMFKNLFL